MDELVKSVACYNPRPILFHGYLAPFFVIQAAVYYYFSLAINDQDQPTNNSSVPLEPGIGNSDLVLDNTTASATSANGTASISEHEAAKRHSYEIWVIAVTISIAAQIVTYLFCHWSVDVKCWLSYSKCNNPHKSRYVKVTPTQNNGSTELVALQRETVNKKSSLYFMFQKMKYIFNEDSQKFLPVEFPCDNTIAYYKQWKGYQDVNEMHIIERQYGKNEVDMTIPEFKELFIERATAPFFVFQTFCVGLWCLDEFWYYALFTLFMLVTFEVVLVKNQMRNMQEIRRMGNQPYTVQVYRQNKWRPIRSDQLISGDLVSIVRSDHNIPCDILLVKGSCIIDESTLTGESVPQMKEPIDGLDDSHGRRLNCELDKLHILFGGTKVLQHTAPTKEQGCVGYVLRTGFQTSQGKLLRTILFGVKRVTANNFETFCFIMFLLVFAIISAWYVWTKGIQDPSRSRYRLFFECTVIITSVVPPELPVELSLAVNTSLLSLSQLFIFCTEPFRIPLAGKVEYCCFDKTGTLTSDDLIVEGVAGLPKRECCDDVNGEGDEPLTVDEVDSIDKKPPILGPTKTPPTASKDRSIFSSHEMVTPIDKCPSSTIQVLASCHSLAHLDEKLVGDPLEKKVLEAINWNYSKSGTVTPRKGRSAPLKIHQRFHFNSTLKRMSVVASYKMDMSNENVYICTAKGAPEFMRPLMKYVPDDYDDVYLQMSRLGARVLALGYRTLGQLNNQELLELKRDDVEKDLMFAGFVLISCPLKPDSREVSCELANSGHQLVMITGDGPLTACHVAGLLSFTTKEVLILSKSKADDLSSKTSNCDEWRWISTDKKISLPFEPELSSFLAMSKLYDFCLTGDSLNFLVRNQKERFSFEILRKVKVFARVSPKQKELIITRLKSRGSTVLMCGDGTNDVGALKHAHVGVALLTSSASQQPKIRVPGNPAPPIDDRQLASKQQQLLAQIQNGQKGAGKQSAAGAGASSGPQRRANAIVQHHAAGYHPPAQQLTAEQRRQQRILEAQAKMRQLLEEQDRPQFVKLGDASIAAPFTSRLSSTQCISQIIKQGRCTLVTTLQMFKILALNALLSAYCHSVLYLEGVKFSDAQFTLQGIISTLFFLFITRSQPLKKLSAQRPLPNIFNLYTIFTVTLQFAVHFSSLLFLYNQAKTYATTATVTAPTTTTPTTPNATTSSTEASAGSGQFEPSLVNSTVFIIWMSVQLSTFVVNNNGYPFMQGIYSNKPLFYSSVGSVLLILFCVGCSPEQLGLVDFPAQFKPTIFGIILINFFLCYIIDRCLWYALHYQNRSHKPLIHLAGKQN